MKVILYKEVPELGEEYTLANVSDGYARNYLFPKHLAGPATPNALASLKQKMEDKAKEVAAKKASFEELAKKLSSLEFAVAVDVGEGGKLFGSVTAQDIADVVKQQAEVDLDKKRINLDSPLKIIGSYSVPVKLYQGITANLKVKVEAKK
ncbi:MAG: 50S ribosomal protein L9 [Candidatus Margulisbacteria bacterium]|nr:50S ribosomal protein L9 [Candidatus Margulisiibacteriota bacterium]